MIISPLTVELVAKSMASLVTIVSTSLSFNTSSPSDNPEGMVDASVDSVTVEPVVSTVSHQLAFHLEVSTACSFNRRYNLRALNPVSASQYQLPFTRSYLGISPSLIQDRFARVSESSRGEDIFNPPIVVF